MSGKQRDQGIRNVLSYGAGPPACGLVRLPLTKIAHVLHFIYGYLCSSYRYRFKFIRFLPVKALIALMYQYSDVVTVGAILWSTLCTTVPRYPKPDILELNSAGLTA